tara:strand:+ start:678 stop:1028 length:351 start_codon:yes stop_codon:yes gene_type:complete
MGNSIASDARYSSTFRNCRGCGERINFKGVSTVPHEVDGNIHECKGFSPPKRIPKSELSIDAITEYERRANENPGATAEKVEARKRANAARYKAWHKENRKSMPKDKYAKYRVKEE